MEGKESDNKDIEVGVNIDSPMPINILGRAIDMKPFAAPVKAVNTLHKITPNAISLGLLTISANTPMNNPAIE